MTSISPTRILATRALTPLQIEEQELQFGGLISTSNRVKDTLEPTVPQLPSGDPGVPVFQVHVETSEPLLWTSDVHLDRMFLRKAVGQQ